MSQLTHYKRVPLAGLFVAMAGTAVLAAFSGQIPLLPFRVILAIVSIGFGTLLPVATVAIQNAVQAHQLGTVTAVANFFRQIGGALIVAVFGKGIFRLVPIIAGVLVGFALIPGFPTVTFLALAVLIAAGLLVWPLLAEMLIGAA